MLEARDFLLRRAVFGPNGARSGHNARRTRQLDLHITGIDTRVKVIQTLVVRTLHKRFFSHCERIAGQVDIQAVNLSTGFRDKRIAVRKNLLWKALGRDRVNVELLSPVVVIRLKVDDLVVPSSDRRDPHAPALKAVIGESRIVIVPKNAAVPRVNDDLVHLTVQTPAVVSLRCQRESSAKAIWRLREVYGHEHLPSKSGRTVFENAARRRRCADLRVVSQESSDLHTTLVVDRDRQIAVAGRKTGRLVFGRTACPCCLHPNERYGVIASKKIGLVKIVVDLRVLPENLTLIPDVLLIALALGIRDVHRQLDFASGALPVMSRSVLHRNQENIRDGCRAELLRHDKLLAANAGRENLVPRALALRGLEGVGLAGEGDLGGNRVIGRIVRILRRNGQSH